MILSAGLTPAWQQVLVLDTLTPGTVNRAREVHWCGSGKVLNVARALYHLGGPCKALTVVGGSVGGAVRREIDRLGLSARWIETAEPTRVCTTILDSARHTATELVPESRELTESERTAFLDAYATEAATAAVVVLIGSLPPGTPATVYRDLLRHTPGRAIVDARGPELLEALAERPFLVKPNREELERTLQRKVSLEPDLQAAMHELCRRGAEWVVVSDGANPLHVASAEGFYRVALLPAREVLNPIGCGDCMAAGIAWAVAQGREPLDAIRMGVAAAADKLGRLFPGLVERASVNALAPGVVITRLA